MEADKAFTHKAPYVPYRVSIIHFSSCSNDMSTIPSKEPYLVRKEQTTEKLGSLCTELISSASFVFAIFTTKPRVAYSGYVVVRLFAVTK